MTRTSTPVVDSLAFIGNSLFGRPQNPDQLVATLAAVAITHVVLAPQRPIDYEISPANDYVSTVVAHDPAHRRQLARVDPNSQGAVSEVRRCVEELRVDGFYLNPLEEVFPINGTVAQKVLDAIAETSMPLVVETGIPWMSEALQVAEIAKRYPHLPVIMTNGGQLNISGLGQSDAFIALDTCRNILIQTAGVYRQDFIESVVAKYGANRVMFASCTPTYYPAYEVLRLHGAALPNPQRDAVLGGTAHSLFWKKAHS